MEPWNGRDDEFGVDARDMVRVHMWSDVRPVFAKRPDLFVSANPFEWACLSTYLPIFARENEHILVEKAKYTFFDGRWVEGWL